MVTDSFNPSKDRCISINSRLGRATKQIPGQQGLGYIERPCLKEGRNEKKGKENSDIFSCHLIINLTSKVCTCPLITEGQCCVSNMLSWELQPCSGFP